MPFDDAGFARVVPPSERRRTARVEFEVSSVRTAYDIDRRTIDAAKTVLQLRPQLDAVAVYLGGFDNVCHALWAYRFPDHYGAARPDDADVAELGSAVDRYLVFLDAALGDLVDSFVRPPNVVVISDHGHEAVLDHPLWRGWHSRRGVFLASGPSVPARAEPVTFSYFDLVPTLLDLVGISVPSGLHGTSILRSPADAPGH